MIEKIRESEYGSSVNNVHIYRNTDTISVEITYPQISPEGSVQHVFVNQESVRASDGIRMHYDYDRDGWVIEQASRFTWGSTGPHDEDWQEVAFIESWARKETDEQEEARLGFSTR